MGAAADVLNSCLILSGMSYTSGLELRCIPVARDVEDDLSLLQYVECNHIYPVLHNPVLI